MSFTDITFYLHFEYFVTKFEEKRYEFKLWLWIPALIFMGLYMMSVELHFVQTIVVAIVFLAFELLFLSQLLKELEELKIVCASYEKRKAWIDGLVDGSSYAKELEKMMKENDQYIIDAKSYIQTPITAPILLKKYPSGVLADFSTRFIQAHSQ